MKILLTLFCLLCMAACGGNFVKTDPNPNILLQEGKQYILNGRVSKAIEIFSRLELKYSFSDQALQAKTTLIWLNYQNGDNDKAGVLVDDYLRYYAFSKYDYYVYYMQALVVFAKISNHGRNSDQIKLALDLFTNYIRRYPNSPEAKDLQFKLPLVLNLLAEQDIRVACYYFSHKDYAPGILRLQDLLANYGQTIYVPEALYRLVWAHQSLGLEAEAKAYYNILQLNFKDSLWLTRAQHLLAKEGNLAHQS